jgi:hypothetical protein
MVILPKGDPRNNPALPGNLQNLVKMARYRKMED